MLQFIYKVSVVAQFSMVQVCPSLWEVVMNGMWNGNGDRSNGEDRQVYGNGDRNSWEKGG